NGKEVAAIEADGSFAGANPSSLAAPGERRTYVYQAEKEGTFILNSTAGMYGLINGNGQAALGLFGAVNVEPRRGVWFRSQVTHGELQAATRGTTPLGQPILDYYAKDANGKPILAMLDDQDRIVASDLTAVIAFQAKDRPQPGPFPFDPANPLCFPV